MTLDREGFVAGEILETLPRVGSSDPGRFFVRYALTWHVDPQLRPRGDQRIALTVAGLAQLPEAEALLRCFVEVVGLLEEQRRKALPPGQGGRDDCRGGNHRHLDRSARSPRARPVDRAARTASPTEP
jgi:hypothetical protein